ncbi:MAG TPA: hypothetical protein VJ866_01360 [Pyrinomonadaceae bacterium]|nr:hypothetical protein [Pyrinomonadaceae bacterium]
MSSKKSKPIKTESLSAAADGRRRAALIRAALQRLKDEGGEEGLVEGGKTSVVTLLREEYKTHLDLYKHYLTVAASFNVLYYAVTGAVVSYALRGERLQAFALTFAVLMTVFFALVFQEAWRLFAQVETDVKDIAESLGCKCDEVHVLTRILQCSCFMYWFNCVALALLFVMKVFGLYPKG